MFRFWLLMKNKIELELFRNHVHVKKRLSYVILQVEREGLFCCLLVIHSTCLCVLAKIPFSSLHADVSYFLACMEFLLNNKHDQKHY